MSLGCANNVVTLKRGGIDYPDLPRSKAAVCSTCRQKVRCTENGRYCLLLEELPLESPRGVRVDGEVEMSIVENLYVLPIVTAD